MGVENPSQYDHQRAIAVARSVYDRVLQTEILLNREDPIAAVLPRVNPYFEALALDQTSEADDINTVSRVMRLHPRLPISPLLDLGGYGTRAATMFDLALTLKTQMRLATMAMDDDGMAHAVNNAQEWHTVHQIVYSVAHIQNSEAKAYAYVAALKEHGIPHHEQTVWMDHIMRNILTADRLNEIFLSRSPLDGRDFRPLGQ